MIKAFYGERPPPLTLNMCSFHHLHAREMSQQKKPNSAPKISIMGMHWIPISFAQLNWDTGLPVAPILQNIITGIVIQELSSTGMADKSKKEINVVLVKASYLHRFHVLSTEHR